MRRILFLVFTVSFGVASFAKDADVSNKQSLRKIKKVFGNQSSLVIIQSREVPRRYTSEIYGRAMQNLIGFGYSDTKSLNLGYKLHINNRWALGIDYGYFLNSINSMWEYERSQQKIPSSLIYYPKNSFGIEGDWYPFYGKALIFGRVVQFDIYASLKAGLQTLNKIENIPYLGLGSGVVFWWNKRLNSRIEFREVFYQYDIKKDGESYLERRYLTNINISLGLLI